MQAGKVSLKEELAGAFEAIEECVDFVIKQPGPAGDFKGARVQALVLDKVLSVVRKCAEYGAQKLQEEIDEESHQQESPSKESAEGSGVVKQGEEGGEEESEESIRKLEKLNEKFKERLNYTHKPKG